MRVHQRRPEGYNSFHDLEGSGGGSTHGSVPEQPPTLTRMVSTEGAGAVHDAIQALASRQQSVESMEGTYYCYICLSNKRISQGYRLTACGHRFCKPCLSGYLTSQFANRQTHPRCFFTDEKGACDMEISLTDIKAVASDEAMQKYIYFSNKENNDNYVDCPKCKTQQLGDPVAPWMACKSCNHEFCFIHQNQHPKETKCSEYEAQVRMEEKKNRAWRSQNTRNCPKCGVATEKNEGCNHMTCFVCKTGWCWLCGEIIGTQVLPDHYKSGECKGKQFTSEAAAYMRQWEALCCIMLPAFFFLLFSPLAFVMAIVVCIISPLFFCFCCCPSEGDTHGECVGLCVHILVFAPILIVTLPFWLPCFIYFHCIIAPRRNAMRAQARAEGAGANDDAVGSPGGAGGDLVNNDGSNEPLLGSDAV